MTATYACQLNTNSISTSLYTGGDVLTTRSCFARMQSAMLTALAVMLAVLTTCIEEVQPALINYDIQCTAL